MTATKYAAQVILGKASIEDVPESIQTSVAWLAKRLGPNVQSTDPVDIIVGYMVRLETEGARRVPE